MTGPIVLFAPEAWGYGETARLLAIARSGAADGLFTPVFADHGGAWGQLVDDAGLPRHVLSPTMSPGRIDRARTVDAAPSSGTRSRAPYLSSASTPWGSPGRSWGSALPRGAMTSRPLGGLELFDAAEVWARVGSEIELVEALRPKVIVHGFSLAFALAARACHVPLVAVRPAAGTRWPYRAGLARWTDARDSLPWRLVPARLRDAARNRAAVRSRRFVAPFAHVARWLDLPVPRTLWDLAEGDVTLIADIAAAAGLGPLPEGVHPIGAIDIGVIPAPIPERRPAAYIDLGTLGNVGNLDDLDDLDDLGDFGDLGGVVSDGAGGDVAGGAGVDVTRVAAALRARGWSVVVAPADARFHRTAVPVTPASLAAFDVTVLCGDPKCVVPAALAGIPIVGIGANGGEEAALDRLAHVGIARRLTRRDATAERIADTCDVAQSDGPWRAAVARIAMSERMRDGAHEAAAIVTSVL